MQRLQLIMQLTTLVPLVNHLYFHVIFHVQLMVIRTSAIRRTVLLMYKIWSSDPSMLIWPNLKMWNIELMVDFKIFTQIHTQIKS